MDAADNLYVADSADSRVLEYDHPHATVTPTATPSPTPTPSTSPTPTPVPTVTPSATASPSSTPTSSASPTSTATPTPLPTATPTPIQFTPVAIGKASGSLNITSSDLHHPTFVVAVFGHGMTGTLALPAGIEFGLVGIGVAPASTSFVVRNAGIEMLAGSVGALSAPFSVTVGGGAFNLAPGQKRFVTVQFKPTASGHTGVALTITSNDPAHPSVNLAIGGKGVGRNLVVNMPSPTPPALPILGFGAVARNSTLAKTFTITNSGRGVLNGAVGAFVNGSPFSVSQGAGAFTLQPHQAWTIGVLFAPAATGRVTAMLAITVNAPSTPASGNVTVAGRGS
jgi:hypothetical protein